MEAIAGVRRVQSAMLATEREKRFKQVEKEIKAFRTASKKLQMMEKRRAAFQKDHVRRRAVIREQLRVKYNLATAAS